MSAWPSWQDDLSDALLWSIYHIHPTTNRRAHILSLPPELLQRIAILTYPGDPFDNTRTLTDILEFMSFSHICTSFRLYLLPRGFAETYFRYMLNCNLGVGRPKDLRRRSWRKLATRVVLDLYFHKGKKSHLHVVSLIEGGEKKFPNPKDYELESLELFEEGTIGPLSSVWEPLSYKKIFDEEDVKGKLISIATPYPNARQQDILPLSLLHPSKPRPRTYPTPPDISIGMTFASCPAMTRMKVYVGIGMMELGDFDVVNEDGVTTRDLDRGLFGFISQPLSPPNQARLISLIPTLTLPTNTPVTIRDIIALFSDPYPRSLPCIMSGRTSLFYEPKQSVCGGYIVEVGGHVLLGLYGLDDS